MIDHKAQLILGSIILSGTLIVSSYILTIDPSGFRASIAGSGSGVKEFDIVMQNNRYNPSRITANLGDRVVINFTNLDNVAHAVEIPQFNATVPGGHVFPGQPAQMEFIADKKISTDAATCGGAKPTDKTDDHGEELIITVT